MSKVDFSLICACYNEGATFEKGIAGILLVLAKLKLNWEIIFVEDKSTDDTRKKVVELAEKVENAQLVLHNKNEGRGKSVSDGIFVSKGRVCGFLDVDCEISPSYIPIFIDEIEKGFDMACATRFYEGTLANFPRVLASKFYSSLVKLLLGLDIADTEAGYKFFNRKKILPIIRKTKDHGWFWDTEICARAQRTGLKISQIPVLFVKRSDKKSTVKLLSDSIDYIWKLLRFRFNLS